MRYLLHKHKLLELLCVRSELSSAPAVVQSAEPAAKQILSCLQELDCLCPSRDDYAKCCLLVTLPSLHQHPDFNQWNPWTWRVACFQQLLPQVEKLLQSREHNRSNNSGSIGDHRSGQLRQSSLSDLEPLGSEQSECSQQDSLAEHSQDETASTGSQRELTGNGNNVDTCSSGDRLLQLLVKGLLYEHCVRLCDADGNEPTEQQLTQLSEALQHPLHSSDSKPDLRLLALLHSLPKHYLERFRQSGEAHGIPLQLQPMQRPSLVANWSEQILSQPIKPKVFPHFATPFNKVGSCSFEQSLNCQQGNTSNGILMSTDMSPALRLPELVSNLNNSNNGISSSNNINNGNINLSNSGASTTSTNSSSNNSMSSGGGNGLLNQSNSLNDSNGGSLALLPPAPLLNNSTSSSSMAEQSTPPPSFQPSSQQTPNSTTSGVATSQLNQLSRLNGLLDAAGLSAANGFGGLMGGLMNSPAAAVGLLNGLAGAANLNQFYEQLLMEDLQKNSVGADSTTALDLSLGESKLDFLAQNLSQLNGLGNAFGGPLPGQLTGSSLALGNQLNSALTAALGHSLNSTLSSNGSEAGQTAMLNTSGVLGGMFEPTSFAATHTTNGVGSNGSEEDTQMNSAVAAAANAAAMAAAAARQMNVHHQRLGSNVPKDFWKKMQAKNKKLCEEQTNAYGSLFALTNDDTSNRLCDKKSAKQYKKRESQVSWKTQFYFHEILSCPVFCISNECRIS